MPPVTVLWLEVLVALGIRHVGGTVARQLARRFGSLPRLMAATEEEIIRGRRARSGDRQLGARVVDRSRQHHPGRQAGQAAGSAWKMKAQTTQAGSNSLAGITIVVTGTLATMTP